MKTDEELAKGYIRLRLEAEGRYEAAYSVYLDDAVRELVRLAYSYGRDGRVFCFGMDTALRIDVDTVIAALLELLDREVEEDAVLCCDGEDRDTLVTWLDGSRYGDGETRREVESLYVDRWASEAESLIACGMLLGYDADGCALAVIGASKDPWHSSLWQKGLAMAGVRDVAASILKAGGVGYGVGRSNVGSHMLGSFGKAVISMGWMHYYKDSFGASADVFRSVTADSSACAECRDEEARGWQPIGLYPDGGWHVNCRCAFIFANSDDI